VKTLYVGDVQDDTVGEWRCARRKRCRRFGDWYLFSRDLQKELNVPVGLIHSSFARVQRGVVSKPVMERTRAWRV